MIPCDTPFWPVEFLLEISWLPNGDSVVCYLFLFSWCFQNFLFIFNHCQFKYYVSQHVPPWVNTMCGSPSFLDFDDCFLPILGKYSANVISSNTFPVLLSLSFPPGNPIANGVFDIVPDVSKQSSFIFIIYSLSYQWFPPFCLLVDLSVLQLHLSVIDYSKCIFHFSFYIFQLWLFFIFYVH